MKKETNEDLICKACKNEYYFYEEKKLYKSNYDYFPIQTSSIVFSSSFSDVISSVKCSKKEILENNCHYKLNNEQIGEKYDELILILKNNYTNENILLLTDNVVFQLSTLNYQNKNILEYIFVSNIDLGECQKLLKNQEKLKEEDELLILKSDLKSYDYSITYVQYEIYHPYNKIKLDLNIM